MLTASSEEPKPETATGRTLIEPVHGVGYKFTDEKK